MTTTTVLPWRKGKRYSLDEIREHARDFYGPRACLSMDGPGVSRVLGCIEAGHDSYVVVELPEAAEPGAA